MAARPIVLAATSTAALQRAAQAHEDAALSAHLDEDDDFEHHDGELGELRVDVLYWMAHDAVLVQGCEIDGKYIDGCLLSSNVTASWRRDIERELEKRHG